MTTFMCPCSNVETEDDGKDRQFEAECSICAVNGGDYKKSPFWKEPESVPYLPPSVVEVDLETGSTDGTVVPFPSTVKARTAANIRGRDKKAKRRAAAAAAASSR